MKLGARATKRHGPTSRAERHIAVRYKIRGATRLGHIVGYEAWPDAPEVYLREDAQTGRINRVRPHKIMPEFRRRER